MEVQVRETNKFREKVEQFCSNIVSETSHLPKVRNLLVKRISNELPEFCNQKTLRISSKIIRIAKRTAEQEISPARRVTKLAAYKEILMDYFNEILPVKSGQKYRLQYFTDKELFFKISNFCLRITNFKSVEHRSENL